MDPKVEEVKIDPKVEEVIKHTREQSISNTSLKECLAYWALCNFDAKEQNEIKIVFIQNAENGGREYYFIKKGEMYCDISSYWSTGDSRYLSMDKAEILAGAVEKTEIEEWKL